MGKLRRPVTVAEESRRPPLLFTGPDGLRMHRTLATPEHSFVGDWGTLSPEGTSDVNYLWRGGSGGAPTPRSQMVGEVGWHWGGLMGWSPTHRQPATSREDYNQTITGHHGARSMPTFRHCQEVTETYQIPEYTFSEFPNHRQVPWNVPHIRAPQLPQTETSYGNWWDPQTFHPKPFWKPLMPQKRYKINHNHIQSYRDNVEDSKAFLYRGDDSYSRFITREQLPRRSLRCSPP